MRSITRFMLCTMLLCTTVVSFGSDDAKTNKDPIGLSDSFILQNVDDFDCAIAITAETVNDNFSKVSTESNYAETLNLSPKVNISHDVGWNSNSFLYNSYSFNLKNDYKYRTNYFTYYTKVKNLFKPEIIPVKRE